MPSPGDQSVKKASQSLPPAGGKEILEEISAKYWALQAHIRLLSIPDGRTGLEAYLQQEARKTGEIVCTGMTREQMARYLGMNRSALSRLPGTMQREDRIELRRGDIRLLKYIET